KIQDGCDRYCSYCIIPTARGPIRFKSLDDIRDEVKTLAQNGYKEIVLVGINLSLYGKGTDLRLIDAIKAVCEIDGVKRVRLGSLEPELLLKEDIEEMARLDKFCPQFHLSLQSGCDETLKRMNRHYTTAEYMHIVDMIREAFPNPAITTDIMVGFAGESDEEFLKSVQFAKDVGFAKVHVFAYSIRKNTRAQHMENQVTRAVKSERSRIMTRETEIKRQEFLKSQIGIISDVLFETMENGKNTGYTKNYCPVLVDIPENLAGRIKKVKIISTDGDFCIGELV
ncbi:MAG: MiaB/RimO family radical SAM methylthiotransferase, partial [Oscillospiraceae bacterium]|nr:MiaB/RimO family radical SAM methylthiotransferase [Oscillospiraceae bacterium]